MNKPYYLIFLLTLVISSCTTDSQSIEELLKVTAQNQGVVNSKFVASYVSKDNGWGINLTQNVSHNLNSIEIDGDNVFVVGDKGSFYTGNTIDNFIKQHSLDININNIDTKKTLGFLFILTEDAILRSSNNGQNFEKLTYQNFPLNQLHISSNNIYNIYDGKLWKSSDNGNSFIVVNPELPFTDAISSKGFYIDSNNNFWIISKGKIYVSQDEGASFSIYNVTSLSSDYDLIYVSPDNNVWVGNFNGILGKSINAGESFALLDLTSISPLATSIHDIKFASDFIWVAVGNGNSGIVKIDYNETNINGVYKNTYGTGINNDLAIDGNKNIWSAESGAIGKDLQNLF